MIAALAATTSSRASLVASADGHQDAADAHHRHAPDLQVQIGRAALYRELQEVVDVHGGRSPLNGAAVRRGLKNMASRQPGVVGPGP